MTIYRVTSHNPLISSVEHPTYAHGIIPEDHDFAEHVYTGDPVVVINEKHEVLHLCCDDEIYSHPNLQVTLRMGDHFVTLDVRELVAAIAISANRSLLVSDDTVHLFARKNGTGPQDLASIVSLQEEVKANLARQEAELEVFARELGIDLAVLRPKEPVEEKPSEDEKPAESE